MATFRLTWLTLGGAWATIIIYLSLIPHPPQPVNFQYSDYLEHALAYGLLMLWFCQIYQKQAHRIRLALCLIALGVSMEFLQRMTGYRYFEYMDMLANSAGVLLGWALAKSGLGRVGAMLEIKLQSWMR